MAGASAIGQQRHDDILVLSLARPPVNAMTSGLMAELEAALRAAEGDPSVAAVVLAAEGAHFSAGLEAGELGRVQGAALPGLVATIEALKTPVVAALQGNVLGGALELALACHARIAQENARLGLPEVSLGLLPVAGATQRLPRLVGAPIALKILLDGLPLTAVEALAMGLLDTVVEAPPLERAVQMARELAANGHARTSDRREGLRDALAYQSAIADARKRLEGGRLPAPMAIVDCVEAALLLPFDMGLAFEQAQAEVLADSAEAAALRHTFMAERRALAVPADLARLAPPKLQSVLVLGTGGAAADVARMALGAGLKVALVGADRAQLTDALGRIAARQAALVAEGQLAESAREVDWARLTGALSVEDGDPADLVLLAPDAPKLAQMPGPVIGLGARASVALHPAPAAGGLALLAVGDDAAPSLQALGLGFGRRLGWRVMLQGAGAALDQRLRLALARAIAALESAGKDRQTIASALASQGLGAGGRSRLPAAPKGSEPIVGFCLAALMNEGARMVSENVVRRPSDVDAAATLSGLFPRWEGGPLWQADRIGLMALRADLRTRAVDNPALFTPAPVIDRLISEGRRFAELNGR